MKPFLSAVILAGGKGSRLASATGGLPKPMVEIGGRSVLEHQCLLLKRYGVREVTIITGHLADVIHDAIGDGSKWDMEIRYFREEAPLGTSGGLKEIESRLRSDFFLFNGDVMFDMDLARLAAFHKNKNALATLTTHPNDHPFDSDLVEMDEAGKVSAFHAKPHMEGRHFQNMVNAGVFVLSPEVLKSVKKGPGDLGRDVLVPLVPGGRVYGYSTPEYLKDMGTPDRLEKVRHDFESGKIARLNLGNKQKAIFLDRDGVLNENRPFIHHPDELVILPGVREAVKKINSTDFLAIVATNQPVVARGDCDREMLRRIHNKLEWQLGEAGAKLDGIYVCPHHPEKGFAGEVPELKVDCDCRKPKPGLLLQAARDFNLDLSACWMVGDHARDIGAGKAAGVRTAGLEAEGRGGESLGSPDRVGTDLLSLVKEILS